MCFLKQWSFPKFLKKLYMSEQNKVIDINSHKPFRLALDIGTNSIGWALYEINKSKKPCRIVFAGVRIFSSGRNPQDHTTLNASRREARLKRRQRDRYLQRQTYLLHSLKKHDLFPEDIFSAKKLKSLNPYELRAKGLDEKLDIHHFGRALFHLNQRRGFKSNRKDLKEKETGVIKQSIRSSKELMEKYQVRTYGEFLWRRLQKMEKSRKHPGSQQENWVLARKAVGAGLKDNYAVYANRRMLEDEFNQLWNTQEKFHEKLKKIIKVKDSKTKKIQDKNLKTFFFDLIFKQRPLKKPVVGKCSLIPEEKRVSRASPLFQKFRILKELNNLAWIDNKGKVHFINKMEEGLSFRDKLIKEHFLKKKSISFSTLEKAFKTFFPEINNFSDFNLETSNRDKLEGHQTYIELKKVLLEWETWSLDIQDSFIELLEGEGEGELFMKTDSEVLEDLKKFSKEKHLNLSQEKLEECLNSLSKLPASHGGYSKKAIKKILPFLEKGEAEFEAIKLAKLQPKDNIKLSNKLPYYQDVLSNHCVEMRPSTSTQLKRIKPSTNKQSKKKKYKNFRIPNPTVHIALNQLRLLVNDIIRVYGRPMQVVVETARDLPLGEQAKKENDKRQRKNIENNKKAEKIIEEFDQKNNRANRIRYFLWEEQKKQCLYSGRNIPKSKLFSAEIEVDHILPWSKTLDDSLSNKALVYKSWNQNKGSQPPFECFSSNEKWPEILGRVKDLTNKNKKWRFTEKAMDKFQEEGGFLARQLNDTRYISKYARKYLKCISPEVWVVRGQSTAIVRNLLKDEKDRQDHRNHAKDALLVGLMDRFFVQRISSLAKRIEGNNKERLENIGKALKQDVLPWPDFKQEAKSVMNKIIVSHRKMDKKEGALHKETAYGFQKKTVDFSKPIDIFHYEEILSYAKANKKRLEKIVSEKIKTDFLKELEENKTLSKEFLENYHNKTGIRRLRIKERESVIPIKNYKAVQSGSNYTMELFENTKGRWDGSVISRFEANQEDFKPVPKTERVMSDDILFFESRFWRLVKFDIKNTLIFIEHFASGNPDEVRKQENTKDQVRQKKPSTLQEVHPKRVDISPCGKVKITDFKLRKQAPKGKV